MTITLSQLALDSSVTTLEFQGYTANITYSPNAITTERLEELERGTKTDTDAHVDFLMMVLKDWDVKLTPNKKAPIDRETLKKLPLMFLKALFEAILEDTSAGEAMGA